MVRKDRFLIALGVKRTSDDLWKNIHGFNNLRSRTGQLLLKIEAIAYTRKCQAKQPCLDTEGATEYDGCSSSLRMDDIHVGP